MSGATLIPVVLWPQLDRLLEESADAPLLVFTHSRSCGTSLDALDELTAHIAVSDDRVRYALVTVQDGREAADRLAARLGIRHHTPQAILVRDGQPVWSASHFRITADTLTRAVRQHVSTPQPPPPSQT